MVSVIIKMRLRARSSHCHLLSPIWLLLPRDTPSDRFQRRLHIVVSFHVCVCECVYICFFFWNDNDNFTIIRSGTHSNSNRKTERETKTHMHMWERRVRALVARIWQYFQLKRRQIFCVWQDRSFLSAAVVLLLRLTPTWETPYKHLFISINSQFIYSAAVQLFMHVPMSHTHSLNENNAPYLQFTLYVQFVNAKNFNFNLLSSVNPCETVTSHKWL